MAEYIERESLLEEVRKDIMGGLNARCIIERFPAANVRPVVRGTWIWKDNGEVVCSECNDLIAIVGNAEDLEMVISGFNFCPNCGAKMMKGV